MEAFGWERMFKLQSLTPLASLFVATFLATNLLVLRIWYIHYCGKVMRAKLAELHPKQLLF